MRPLGISLLFLTFTASFGRAQSDLAAPQVVDYWFDVFYPKVFYSGREGFTGGGYFAFVQPVRFIDFESPVPYRASIGINVQASTSGSRSAILEARLPQYVDGWRFAVILSGRRDARDNYFGIGSNTRFDDESVNDSQPHFYEALHTRWVASLEAQRYLIGDLRLLFGLDLQRWKIAPLEGPSVITDELTAGVDPTIGQGTTEVAGRIGAVFDSRDSEVFARRGAFVQLVATGASDGGALLGEVSYTRLTFQAEGHIPLTSRLNLSGRVVAQATDGTPRLGTFYTPYAPNVGSGTVSGLGGGGSHRGLPDNRFLGRHLLLTNFDVRYTVYAIPTLVQVTAVGFVDAGRVFEGESFKLTTDDLKVGGGTGVFVQIGRSGVLGLTGGSGPDGLVFDIHTRWPF